MAKQQSLEIKLKEVGARIKALREAIGFSVEEISTQTGVSINDYLQYESGDADPGFSFFYKVATICNVEISDIMEGQSPILSEYNITRKGEGMSISGRKDYIYQNLAPLFKDKLAEPFYVKIPYVKGESSGRLHTHKGQEIDIILKGSLKITIGDREEVLNEGDSIYYDSSNPHDECAVGGEDCEMYAIVINPDPNKEEVEVENLRTTITSVDKANLLNPVYEKFIETENDSLGVLKKINFRNEDEFNFAFDVVDELAKKVPFKTAMFHVSAEMIERRFTFGDMGRYSSMAANYFQSLGIKKGDRVMLVIRRHYQFWFAILGLHKLGAIAIPATDLLMEHDYEYRFKAAGVSAIICTAKGHACTEVEKAEKTTGISLIKIVTEGTHEGWISFDNNFTRCSEVFPRTEESPKGKEPMLMFFTSGTTGYPKIAIHDFRYPLGHFITAKYWHNVNPNGLHFTVADTGWGKALWGKLYGQWLCEAGVFTYDFDKFTPTDILPMFKKYNITTFCAPPTIYRFLIKEDLSKYDLSTIEYATTAGEALNLEVYTQFLKATGLHIMEGFGQTETTLSICNLVGSFNKPGSMGKPSPLYDVSLMLPDGTPAKIGETGEIVISTANGAPCGLYMGYYLDPENTAKVWYDNVYHTGDTAYMDEDGYYWYVGRVDDIIKSSGYRIGPFEIESVIMELPYVLECAVTGVPDPTRGQIVKASIVLTKGTVQTDELKKEIQEYVKSHTAPYKYPRVVEFLDEMPKTISGKIKRTDLRNKN
ncbi:MAG: AMP-binding protein [Lachnospiraceae bacterium]|nr:AMP-binding protein [Lachnospiraceae bacterium]